MTDFELLGGKQVGELLDIAYGIVQAWQSRLPYPIKQEECKNLTTAIATALADERTVCSDIAFSHEPAGCGCCRCPELIAKEIHASRANRKTPCWSGLAPEQPDLEELYKRWKAKELAT